uniref:Aquaporin n=1 Tax=Araucaria cunninghamii TaxID=56994 RepID=A0A0D6R8R2_ARACU
MAAVTLAVGDAVITFLWVFFVSCMGAATSVVAAYLNVEGAWQLGITTALLFVMVFVFSWLGDAMGGVSWNPTMLSAAFALGSSKDSLFGMALRFPAQAAGAVGGALAIMELMPPPYKHMLGGPSLKVELHRGAVAEGVLTFFISFMVLLIIAKGPKSSFLKSWLISLVTIALVLAGSPYTGPSMNPANAFGWAYVNNRHNTWEQFYVYWITPFIGSILAAWFFRVFFSPDSSKKEKKA